MSKNGRILLVNPPSFKNTEAFAPEYMLQRNAFDYPSLGLLYLAANLPGHFERKIIDSVALEYTNEDCLDDIKIFQPGIVGLIVFTDSLYCCYFHRYFFWLVNVFFYCQKQCIKLTSIT